MNILWRVTVLFLGFFTIRLFSGVQYESVFALFALSFSAGSTGSGSLPLNILALLPAWEALAVLDAFERRHSAPFVVFSQAFLA
jgi:hypothetical protein